VIVLHDIENQHTEYLKAAVGL